MGKLKEEEAQRAIEQRNREKEEQDKPLKEKSSKDQVAHWLSSLKKKYKDENPEGLKTCLSTLKIYIKNLMENPQDPKFKKLKLENKAFQSRIAPYEGAIEFLDVMGFDKKEDCLEQRKSIPD